MHGLDDNERPDTALITPGEEIAHRATVGLARVGVMNLGGEEFDEPLGCEDRP